MDSGDQGRLRGFWFLWKVDCSSVSWVDQRKELRCYSRDLPSMSRRCNGGEQRRNGTVIWNWFLFHGFFLAFFWVIKKLFGRICGLILICCGLLVVCAQICGLMVRFLGGRCLFPLFQIWFLEWFNDLCSFWGGCWWFLLIWSGCWQFAFSRILSFQTLENFYNVKNFTFENILHRNKWSVVVIACSFEVVTA